MAGVDSAGLGEVIQNILSRFSEEEKGRLVKVSVFRKVQVYFS
jgi:actin-related protein 5